MSTPLKQTINFIVMTPVVINLKFKVFQSEFNGTEEMWIRLLEKAGKKQEFVEQSPTGLYLNVLKDNSDIVPEAEDFVTSFIEDTTEIVREEIEEEKKKEDKEVDNVIEALETMKGAPLTVDDLTTFEQAGTMTPEFAAKIRRRMV